MTVCAQLHLPVEKSHEGRVPYYGTNKSEYTE